MATEDRASQASPDRATHEPSPTVSALRVGIPDARKHLATCGSVGMWGRRVGTTYAYTPRAAWGLYHQPWFRFRNDECEQYCWAEWTKPDPTEGDFFVVAEDQAPPECGYSTKLYATDPLRKCSLVRWEGEVIRFGRSSFCRLGETDFYQWYEIGNDYAWSPRGRLLRLNAQGIEARSDETAQQAQPEGREPDPKDAPK